MDLSAFYQLLKTKTGVDISTPVAMPGDTQPTAVQAMIDGKNNVADVAGQRTFDREYKQQSKPPSIFLQAQRAMSGDTLLTRNK